MKNSSLINKIQYSEKILSQAFEELNQCFFLKLDGNKDIYENCKNEWRTNQIILNLPFDEVEKYINDKKANLPTAFGDFYDFVE